MENSAERQTAIAQRPNTVLTPPHTIDVPAMNELTAADRAAAIQNLVENLSNSVLARARWAIDNKDVLLLPDLDDVAEEIIATNTISILRRCRPNVDIDRLLNGINDDLQSANNQLVAIIRRKERDIHADALARASSRGGNTNNGGSGGNVGNGADGASNSRRKPARERLRPGTGIAEFTGTDNTISIQDFLLAAADLFNAADEGASDKLTPTDKVLHLRTLIVGTARDTLRLEEKNLRDGAYEFNADILNHFDIPTGTWRDITVHHPADFTDFLRYIFTSRSDADQRKDEYRAIVARGYAADPDTLRRQLQRARTAIGGARPDIAVSDEQLLQDFLSMLPTEHCTKVYESPEYTRSGGAGITIDVAARVAQNYHRALMRTSKTGRGNARLVALLPKNELASDMDSQHDTTDRLAALENAISALSTQLTAQTGDRSRRNHSEDDNNDDDLDALNAIAAAAAHNSSLYSLAQRQYNGRKRQEIRAADSQQAASGQSRGQDRVRCWGCGQLGHVRANCPHPPSRPEATPFRRIAHRESRVGRIGGARPVRFFRKHPNTHRLMAIQDHEIAQEEDYVYALEVGDDDEQAFIIA
jgi:hypothetical protein